jgi:nucleoporin NDC1
MSYFIILALVQTGVHLWYDYDRISMPELKIERGVPSEQAKSLVERPSVQMKAKLPGIAMGAVQRALLMTCIAPFIYAMIIRQSAWSWSLMFAKMIWNLPKSTAMPAITPFHVHILWRTFTGGIMLIMMWEIANTAFTINVAQEPNGSLLLGLKAKRLQTRVSTSVL